MRLIYILGPLVFFNYIDSYHIRTITRTKTITNTITKTRTKYKSINTVTRTLIRTLSTPQTTYISQIPVTQVTSIATYYFRVNEDVPGCIPVQTFNDGNLYGQCNGGVGVKYTSASKYWAAIYNGNNNCGRTIRVTYGQNILDLIVMDTCPSCSDNHVDMGLEALIELTGSKETACAIGTTLPIIKWWFIT